MPDKKNIISVNQLQVGVYIHLDMGWAQHPFSFNNFKLKDNEQIRRIKSLGIKTVRWNPERSDVNPLKTNDQPTDRISAKGDESEPVSEQINEEIALKNERIKQLAAYRKKIEAVEESFLKASQVARKMIKQFILKPEESVEEASKLVQEIIQTMTNAPELALQVISGKNGNSSIYSHALNVSIMTLIFAYEMKLPSEKMFLAGLGAMLHDIGLAKVPEKVVNNRGQLSKVEIAARRHHCEYGVEIGKRAKLNSILLDIIYQHHEYFNGSGYPQGLSGDEISELAQLIGLVNHYDNLCNPQNASQIVPPHMALSVMYAKQGDFFKPELLQGFIRFMGVYPPGCVVSLSNDCIGIVIKVYSSKPLRPTLILYDENVPKNEAIILDLRDEPDVNISKAINPSHLPVAIFDYLSPQERINYYFDTV